MEVSVYLSVLMGKIISNYLSFTLFWCKIWVTLILEVNVLSRLLKTKMITGITHFIITYWILKCSNCCWCSKDWHLRCNYKVFFFPSHLKKLYFFFKLIIQAYLKQCTIWWKLNANGILKKLGLGFLSKSSMAALSTGNFEASWLLNKTSTRAEQRFTQRKLSLNRPPIF